MTADTVAEARAEAAGAMDAVVRAVKAHGLEDQDVQTRSFNIWPQYEYPEVTSGGTRTRRQVLVGYTVSNMAGIKIRDVDAVGAIIDDVAEAGGDKTRIDGVNFSVEDPEPFMAQLRQEAVRRRRRQGRPLREPHGRGRRRSGLHRRDGSRHAGGSELRVWGGSHGENSRRTGDFHQRRRAGAAPERAGSLLHPVAAIEDPGRQRAGSSMVTT